MNAHGYTRRDFLRECASVGAGGFLLSNRALRVRVGAKRPNILFIMSDEHNAGVVGCYGNSTVRTPSLDALAKQGVTFEGFNRGHFYYDSPTFTNDGVAMSTTGQYASGQFEPILASMPACGQGFWLN